MRAVVSFLRETIEQTGGGGIARHSTVHFCPIVTHWMQKIIGLCPMEAGGPARSAIRQRPMACSATRPTADSRLDVSLIQSGNLDNNFAEGAFCKMLERFMSVVE